MNNKAQFGPDFIVAMLVILIIGIGGVVFMNLFVGGLSMQGLLTIIDSESDQKCFSILMAMVTDEYITTGEDVSGMSYFGYLQSYYSLTDMGVFRSIRFEEKMDVINDSKSSVNFRPGSLTNMYYHMTSRSNAKILRGNIQDDIISRGESIDQYIVCSIPVFGVYESGVAELYMKIEE